MRDADTYRSGGVWLSPLFLLAAAVSFLFYNTLGNLRIVLGVFFIFFAFMIVYRYLEISYIFGGRGLIIETSAGSREIVYDSIVSIEEKWVWLTAPLFKGKWSDDRTESRPALWSSGIMIVFGASESVFISPVRRNEFLSKLETRCRIS